MEIGVLDLGSTTFHLQHFAVEGGRLLPGLDVKRTTCLGSHVFAEGHIDPSTWAENVQAVAELLESSRLRQPAVLRVVATSAIRSAGNGRAFARDLERRFGIRVQVLDSDDEARLSFLGQASTGVAIGRRITAVDIGGGSVELAAGEAARCLRADSLPMGALRLLVRSTSSKAAGLDAEQGRELAATLRERLRSRLAPFAELCPELVVFGSGSARAARKLLMRNSNIPGKVGPLELSAFRAALDAHIGLPEGRLIELGVEPARAPSVLVVALLMAELIEGLGVPHAYVSDKGLRDGVALQAVAELLGSTHPRAVDARSSLQPRA